ncbi:MAG: hypothetical protein KTR17_02370 [Cellvibrionaceae bacterium]|nr:hypothetical protein [Cellvibrionaceae bacterium]
MSNLNIHDFCKDTAKILLILYKHFPQRITLYVEDISGPDQPDEFGLHSPRFLATFHTLLWLAETDYLRFSQTVKQEALENVTLSHRAFVFLSGGDPSPQDGKTSPPRIEVLRTSLNTESSETLKQRVLNYMEQSRHYQ